MKKMKKTRVLERFIGVLFILATLTYGIGNQMSVAGLKHNSLTSGQILGMGLELLNSAIVIGIGVLMFQVLKNYDKSVIKGYVVSRIIEGFLLAVGAISILWITESNLSSIMKFKDLCFSLAMLSLGAYSLRFFWYLLQNHIAPKWMMMLGIFGYLTLCIYAVQFTIFGEASMLLFIPGGVFELFFPIYLILKGYRASHK